MINFVGTTLQARRHRSLYFNYSDQIIGVINMAQSPTHSLYGDRRHPSICISISRHSRLYRLYYSLTFSKQQQRHLAATRRPMPKINCSAPCKMVSHRSMVFNQNPSIISRFEQFQSPQPTQSVTNQRE